MDISKIFKPVFIIRIQYKSGQRHDYHCYSFKYTASRAEYEYESARADNKPLKLGIDDFESIWQVGHYYEWPLGIHRLCRWF